MPKKGTKAARRSGKKGQDNAPAQKDDGTRWIVRDRATKYAIYGHKGVIKSEAERLATGLREPAYIEQIF